MKDIRFAIRQLTKSPGFTTVAVLTFALGIGACTAMFSIVNRVLLRPLPYAEPGQLVQIWEDSRGDGTGRNTVAGGVAKGWQDQSRTFESIAVFTSTTANLTGTERPARLRGLQVSPDYLHVLRLSPVLGRDFNPDEGQTGMPGVVILSHAAWQNYCGGDPSVVGKSIRLGDRPRTIVGILSSTARLTPSGQDQSEPDFLLPFAFGTPGWNRGFAGHNLEAIGRLQPTATLDQARAEMNAISERQSVDYPAFKKNWRALLVPLHEEITGPIRPQLLLLFGATACVLLIACANVAGLLLARAVSRGREMALRLTLGASRWSVARKLLTENLLLALAGGALGVLVALWSVEAFAQWRPPHFAPGLAVALDGRALGFALAVSVITGLVAGLVPAWRLAHTRFDELRSGSRSSDTGIHTRIRGALIIGQVSLSLVLLIGAGLLLRSLIQFQSAPFGFDPSNTLIADLTLESEALRDSGNRARYLADMVEQVEAVPGVDRAAIAYNLPLVSAYTEVVRADGSTEQGELSIVNFLSGDYLTTMRIPLVAGRRFTAADNQPDAPPAMLINSSLAAKLFPNEDPIGRRIQLLGVSYEVVGLTGDVMAAGIENGRLPLVFLPEALSGRFTFRSTSSSLVVRTHLPPLSVAKSVQTAILAFASDQPVSNLRTYDHVLVRYMFTRRLMLGLFGVFAGIAVGLAAMGLYGIIAFSVDRRTRELGIRSALGASRENLVLLVLGAGFKLTAAGIALGMIGGIFFTRLVSNQLYGISATDPLTLVGVALFLAAVALLACWLPARRATRIDPMEALREE